MQNYSSLIPLKSVDSNEVTVRKSDCKLTSLNLLTSALGPNMFALK